MKAPAIIASVTIACSLGFAAGQGRVSVPPQSPDQPSLPPASGDKRSGSYEGGVAMQVGGEGQCVIGEPLNWFTTVHVLPQCASSSHAFSYWLYGSPDCDGDQSLDHLTLISRLRSSEGGEPCYPGSSCFEFGGSIYTLSGYSVEGGPMTGGGSGLPFPFQSEVGVYRYSMSRSGGATMITYQSVLSGAVLNQAACAVAPCHTPAFNFFFSPKQLHDWDGDGDLDLVAQVDWYVSGQSGSDGSALVVVENTVTADTPLAADINEDGVVDGKDLASVLAAWTP